MAHSRTPEFDLILEYLSFEWENVDTILSSLRRKVQPGRAIRQYTKTYERSHMNSTGKGIPKGKIPESDQLVSGAKSLLRQALRSLQSSGLIARQSVDGVVYYRRDRFNAEDIDRILANMVAQAAIPKSDNDPAVGDFPKVISYLFDLRTVKVIEVRNDTRYVTVDFPPDANDDRVSVVLSSDAADWLSDQLGFQALMQRKGRTNPAKAVPVNQSQ